MATHIEMPKLSDTMTEGTVVRWLKSVGDQVEIGDEIAEIETDKATMAMEAFDEGILAEILIEEGAKAEIGATLAVLRDEGEGDPAQAPPAAEPEPAIAEPAQPVPATAQVSDPPAEPEPVLTEPAPAPAVSPQVTEDAPEVSAASDRIKASPLARKLASAHGVDLAGLTGSGPGGRIVKKDVEKAANSGAVAPAPENEPKVSASPPPAAPKPVHVPAKSPPPAPSPGAGDHRVELSSLRRIIAERLLTSKTTIPHFYLHAEADAAPLMEIRRQINVQAEATHGNKYTVNDLILKAVIGALQAVPSVNATYQGDHILQFGEIGVSVAVAVEDGLVTPVVRNAAAKSLLQISKEVKDLANRARDGKLLPNEFDGGTITVSNLGAYGIESFDAIINPPQAAIISVGSIVEKAVVENGEIVPGLRLNLGLSCDHRVVDGAVGAEFLSQVKKLIEKPALMLV
ncbi:MAG: pyruvate dehydrogenase complex dihydrolipoamide acetyltransferase [Roseibacillus sp.]|nr:pyruvate dehydrogenase complex dihydrolipoamide acetyltransferase [Roseibacillus sp.]MBB81710.1 pyruvate dehydrogenase complex dihydrolipoamide acetyltransferase [Roseibacillus sp.]